MARRILPLGTSLVLLALIGSPLWAGGREVKTVEKAAEVIHALSDIPLKGIPRALLHDAAGVAVIPHVIKAGVIVDARFGRGVILLHEPNGLWSNPVFVNLSGAGIGGQAGIESTDLVLVFKSRGSVDRALKGRLALGEDVTIAAGPIGRDWEAARDGRFKAEIYSYSRSRGLFAGISLEGAGLHVDTHGNKQFYGLHTGHADEVLNRRGAALASAEALKAELTRLSGYPQPSAIVPYRR